MSAVRGDDGDCRGIRNVKCGRKTEDSSVNTYSTMQIRLGRRPGRLRTTQTQTYRVSGGMDSGAEHLFRQAFLDLVGAVRSPGARLDRPCLDLARVLRAATESKIRLPSLACLQPLSAVLKLCVGASGPDSAAVVGSGLVDSAAVAAALGALDAAVQNAVTSAHQIQISEQAVEKQITDAYAFILMIFDKLQSRAAATGEQADDEAIAVQCATCYDSLLQLLGPISHENPLFCPRILSGPFLAQVVQALLRYGAHRSKRVSVAALECFDRLLVHSLVGRSTLGEPTVWQQYFPGIFSGLYSVATSGFKRGRRSLFLSLCAMVRALHLVLRLGAGDDLVASLECGGKGAFRSLLRTLQAGQESGRGNDVGPAAVVEHPWRRNTGDAVTVKILSFFPKAYRAVYGQCTTSQRCAILVTMDSLLCCKGCYTYFTHAEIANLLRLVYSVTHVGHAVTGDSESDSLRDSNPHAGEIKMAAGVLSNVKTRYCEAGAWDSLVMQLRQLLRDDLLGSMDLGSHGGREGDLSWYLAAVVGAAEFLGDDVEETRTLPMTPEIGLGDPHVWRGLFLRCLKTLLVPDLAGQRVAVIESRRYTKLATEEFVAGEYYRVDCRSVRWKVGERDDQNTMAGACGALIIKMCMLYGRQGNLMDALAAVQSGHRGLGDLGVCLSSPGAVDSSSVNAGGFHGTLCADSNNDYSQVYEQSLDILVARNKQAAETGRRELLRTCEFSLQELLGGWMCLRLVLRGYLELDVRDPVALCAVCKAIAPPGGLLKCSRCKIAVYCCKQHQREDWSIHKAVCSATTFDSFARKPSATVSAELRSILSLCVMHINAYLGTPGVAADRNDRRERRPKHAPHWTTTPQLTLGTALLVATATESIADVAEFAAESFQPHLIQVLYPLLLLSIDGNAIVKVAAMTSLSRIALYLGLRDTASLIRHNLDYVTNTVCISLRESILLANSQSKLQSNGLALVNFCSRVPMLVEHIMALSSSCSCSSDAIDTSENVLLSDMILNIMDAVDSFAVSGLLNFAEINALLRVMYVVVDRTEMPSVRSISPVQDMLNKGNVGEVRSLNTFVTSIRELRAVENCKVTGEDTVAVGEDSDADLNEETVCPQQQLLVDIVLRCIYFLSTPSSPIMGISYSVVRSSLKKLGPFRRVVLPLMHKLWPVLVNRLRDLAKVLLVTYAQRANSPNSSCRLRIDEVGQLAVPATDTVKYVRLADSSAEQIKGFQCLTLDRTGHKISDNSLNHNLNISRSSLHNLPALLELITTMVNIGGDFMSKKIEEDFWPEINRMLVSICSREFGDRESSPGYADYGNLGITIKEALLNSLYRLLQQHKYMPHDGHVGPYVVRAAPAVAFMMLSFLHSRQVPCIREQAELLLQCLYSLDPSWVHVMFTAAGGGHDAENMWNELTSDPRLDPIFFAICDFLGTTVRTAFSRRQVFLMFLRWMRLDETFRHHLDKLSLLHSCSPRQIKKGSDPNAHVDGGIVDAVLGADKRWQRGIVQWAGI